MLERLNEALEHVERHLTEPVDGAELARIAATSEYHFRRLFSALAGMPLSEYVRRRRLTVAGAEVLSGTDPLLDIAVRYGYGSGEAFARAFRAVHGVGPSQARRTGAALCSQPRMSFRLVVEGSSSMRYRIVRKDAFQLVGPRTRIPLVHLGQNTAITQFVRGIGQRTLRALEELSDQEPPGVIAATSNIEAPRTEGSLLDYHHGVVTGAVAPEVVARIAALEDRSDLAVVDVPAGEWAVFQTSGQAPEAIQYLWRDVFTEWFPANPYEFRPAPELLSTRFPGGGDQVEAEVWVPVRSAERREG